MVALDASWSGEESPSSTGQRTPITSGPPHAAVQLGVGRISADGGLLCHSGQGGEPQRRATGLLTGGQGTGTSEMPLGAVNGILGTPRSAGT